MKSIADIVAELGCSPIRREAESSPPTDDDFADLEDALGGRLPDDYRTFVRLCGGGMLGTDDAQAVVPFAEPTPWGDSACPEEVYFVGTGRDSAAAMLSTFRGRLPRGVLPFAGSAGGNQFCLDVAGQFPGSVWFWDHEQRWIGARFRDMTAELEDAGVDTLRMNVHAIVREWARRHEHDFDRPPDYVGMYRIADSFRGFLNALEGLPYEQDSADTVQTAQISKPSCSTSTAHQMRGRGMSSKTKVREVGFFREMDFGDDCPSLAPAIRTAPATDEDKLLRYLRSGLLWAASPGALYDAFSGEPIGTPSTLTDGTYAWPEVLAHYVARYHLSLPEDFLAHAKKNGWKVPDDIDLSALTI